MIEKYSKKEERREEQKTEAQAETSTIIDLHPDIAIMALNVPELNTPIKSRHYQKI